LYPTIQITFAVRDGETHFTSAALGTKWILQLTGKLMQMMSLSEIRYGKSRVAWRALSELRGGTNFASGR